MGLNIDISNYDLTKEKDRIASFTENGFCNQKIDFRDLALVGFFFFRRPDLVKCEFCQIVIGNFERGDIVIEEHLKHSPNCPLLTKRRATANIPIDKKLFQESLPPISKNDVCGIQVEFEYPEFESIQRRLESFGTWPIGIKQKPMELASVGFFYSGQSDIVICFSCGLQLNEWKSNDNPQIEHTKHKTTKCSYQLKHEQ